MSQERVSTEYWHYKELAEKFRKISELIRQINLNLTSGFSRILPFINEPAKSKNEPEETNDQAISSSVHEQQIAELKEALKKAEKEIEIKDRELKAMHLQYMQQIKQIDSENRAYNLEAEECKAKLLRSGEELSQATDVCQAKIMLFKQTVDTKVEDKIGLLNDQHEAELQKLKLNHILELEKVKADMHAQLGEAEIARIKALDEFTMLKQQSQELQETYEEEKATLTDKINKADAEHSSILAKMRDLEMEMATEKFEKMKTKEELETMKAHLEDRQKELQSYTLSYDDLISDHENLKVSLSKVTEDFSVQRLLVESYEKKILDLKKYISSRKQEMDNLGAENNELRVKLKKARKIQRTQSQQLEEARAKLEEHLRNKEADIQRKFLDLRQEVELSRNTIEELTKKCAALRCDMEDKDKGFQKERKVTDITISAFAKHKKHLEDRIASLTLKDKRNAEIIAKLRGNNAELESVAEASVKANQQLEEKINTLTLKDKHNAELIEQLSAKKAELDSLKEALNIQQVATESINRKRHGYLEQKQELMKEIEHLKKALKSQKRNNQSESKYMKETIATLLDDKAKLEANQDTLNKKLNELMDQLGALPAISSSNLSLGSAPVMPPAPDVDPQPGPSAGPVNKWSLQERSVRRAKRRAAYDDNRKDSGLRECSGSKGKPKRFMQNGADEESSD